jgi:hypothetical protein
MLVYIPKGKKDGIQIMPIADVTAKDEFSAVKNISRDDMLAAHRTPPHPDRVIPRPPGLGNVARPAMPSSRPRSCRSCAACCASTMGRPAGARLPRLRVQRRQRDRAGRHPRGAGAR